MGQEYRMIVSDKTGAFLGDLGLSERLAFRTRFGRGKGTRFGR